MPRVKKKSGVVNATPANTARQPEFPHPSRSNAHSTGENARKGWAPACTIEDRFSKCEGGKMRRSEADRRPQDEPKVSLRISPRHLSAAASTSLTAPQARPQSGDCGCRLFSHHQHSPNSS